MSAPKVCLTITASTIMEAVHLAKENEPWIDLIELRADYLWEDELPRIGEFPTLVSRPCILTIRRKRDGGLFEGDDIDRTVLFSEMGNYAYVDLETDLRAPKLQILAELSHVKIIRSAHYFEPTSADIISAIDGQARTESDIPKIAFTPRSAADMAELFTLVKQLPKRDRIICAMGSVGFPSRVLAQRLGSYLTFTSPKKLSTNTAAIGHTDPISLQNIYGFKNISDKTALCGVTGWPLTVTSSPEVHRKFYEEEKLNALMLPMPAEKIEDALKLAETLNMKGLAVTIPHKEILLAHLDETDEAVKQIGAANTVVFKDGKKIGHNTDAPGFAKALKTLMQKDSLKGLRAAVLGSGGAAKAIAYALFKEGAEATVFARDLVKAKAVADKFGFASALLTDLTSDFKPDIIVQCTSVGLQGSAAEGMDPIPQYEFQGREVLYDIVYKPEATPIIQRAQAKGCLASNGLSMLIEQAKLQHQLFFHTT
jgi:3-dehydroquinate dehydratase/shikimate dehydrogenase